MATVTKAATKNKVRQNLTPHVRHALRLLAAARLCYVLVLIPNTQGHAEDCCSVRISKAQARVFIRRHGDKFTTQQWDNGGTLVLDPMPW
ncbi:hypothetical protein J8F10_18035 [Gemmata sp. G18]|uniref:Uncharacterized protein n=1 Tax=Gemmata palustris TaxID=2822762 RepID=A0ABS5BTX7_9BACT|nr:hypothetical protein [Gemmata palustris]MBP3957166.1 hypothetical protein [Gemmata palustris]